MGKGKLYEVELTAKEIAPGEFEFDPKTDLKHSKGKSGIAQFVFNKKDDKMPKDDCYLIQFVLVNGDKVGLRFPYRVEDAMWVCRAPDELSAEEGCPKEPCYIDEMKGLAVLGDHTLLAVNKDSKTEFVVFTLNFVKQGFSDTDKDNYVPWDPIGNNQDGGWPFVDQ